MMQVLRFHTRQFHVTNTLLRRIVRRNYGASEGQEDFTYSVDVPAVQESNFDYLGIESDKGAITVRPQKHSVPQNIRTSGRLKERFYRATYGVVRYDTDNKPKYHGQYNNRMDFDFPYRSSDDVEVLSSIPSSSDGQVLPKVESFNNLEPNTYSAVGEDNSEHIFSNDANEDLNYVDESYFGGSKIVDFSNGSRSEKSTSDELNFVDEYYFGNENPAAFSSNTTVQNVMESGICTTKFNFAEKDDLTSLKEYPTSDLDNDNAKKLTSDEMNFIDSNYLKNVDVFKHSPEIFLKNDIPEEKQLVFDKRYPQEATNNASEPDYNEELNDNFSFSSNLKLNDSVKDNSVNSHLYHSNTQKILDNNVQNVTKSATESSYPLGTEINDLGRTCEVNQKITKQSSRNNLTKPKSLSDMLKLELNLKKNVQEEADLESHSESKRPSSNKNNFKYSSADSTESSENGQVSTAYDFVAKLRKQEVPKQSQQEVPKQSQQEVPKQSQQKVITEENTKKEITEKVDSKGFRILKTQVPDLSQFTRSEIIDLLKRSVVYSDDDLIVLNKPYSLIMHESETTKEYCLSMFLDELAKEMDPKATDSKLFTVHRLDKETTGCLLLARNEMMAQNLKSLFAQRKIIKKYWIITIKVPDPVKGIIDMPIAEGYIQNKQRMVLHPKLPKDMPYQSHSRHGRPAVTSYEVISESGNAALVEATAVTGIKHQIRVHFGFGLGCPILGDHKYSHLDKLAPQKLPADILQRLCVRQSKARYIPMHLHAKSVMIPRYFQGRDLFVNIPLPDHMKNNLKSLKFKK